MWMKFRNFTPKPDTLNLCYFECMFMWSTNTYFVYDVVRTCMYVVRKWVVREDVGTKNFSPSPKSFAIQLELKHAIAFIDKRRYYIDQQGMDRGLEELWKELPIPYDFAFLVHWATGFRMNQLRRKPRVSPITSFAYEALRPEREWSRSDINSRTSPCSSQRTRGSLLRIRSNVCRL